MNNDTTCKQPLQPVAEHSEVIRQRIEGTLERDGKHGQFRTVLSPDAEVAAPVRSAEALREDLGVAVQQLRLAIERARAEYPDSVIKIMIAAENPDGSGRIAAKLDHAEFLEDVAALLNLPEPTTADRAHHFLLSHGLTGE